MTFFFNFFSSYQPYIPVTVDGIQVVKGCDPRFFLQRYCRLLAVPSGCELCHAKLLCPSYHVCVDQQGSVAFMQCNDTIYSLVSADRDAATFRSLTSLSSH